MAWLLSYLIKLSFGLTFVYLFYLFFLRKLTFYNWNRFYLLFYTLVAIFLPFINLAPVLEQHTAVNIKLIKWIPSFATAPINNNVIINPGGNISWTIEQWILFIYTTGAFILLLRLFVRLLSLRKLRKNAVVVIEDNIKIYQVNKPISPFSFAASIYINRQLHDDNELKEIIKHEYVHIKQYHTIDIIWAELLSMVNWFNPFVWFIRKTIHQNLEFIVDRKILQSGISCKQYQYLLLKVNGNPHFSIATNFNFSSLKNRVIMMNKTRSTKRNLIIFLFVLPLMAALSMAFRGQDEKVLSGPLYILDGEIMPAKFDLNTIETANIYSIQVLKGDRAAQLFGQKAEKGIIGVMTKAFREEPGNIKESMVPLLDSVNIAEIKRYISVSVYMIDGIALSPKSMEEASFNNVASIEWLHGAEHVQKYGEKARIGIAIIHMKNE